VLDLRWRNEAAFARLQVDVATGEHALEFSGADARVAFHILRIASTKEEP
jgi:hypothetical protein